MRAWMLLSGSQGFDELYMTELADPSPGPGEMLIAPQGGGRPQLTALHLRFSEMRE